MNRFWSGFIAGTTGAITGGIASNLHMMPGWGLGFAAGAIAILVGTVVGTPLQFTAARLSRKKR